MIVKNFIDKYSQWISLVFWIVLVIFSVIEVDKVGFSNIWGFVLLSGSVGFGFNLALIIIQSRTIMNFYVDYDDEIQLGEGDEFHNFTCDEKIEFLLISILEIYSDSIYGDDFTRYIFNMAKDVVGIEEDYYFDEHNLQIRRKESK